MIQNCYNLSVKNTNYKDSKEEIKLKTSQRLKAVILILVIVLITILAFLGVYNIKKVNGDNLVKDYNVGMELKGKRIVTLKVDDTTNEVIYDSEGNIVDKQGEEGQYTVEHEPVNAPEVLTKENYKKAKKIIEDRLISMDAEEYILRFNEETGNIELEFIDNRLTDYLISAISLTGDFKIIDDETKEVLIDRKLVKSAKVVYSANNSSNTTVYLDIEFNKDGSKKLDDISRTYIQTTEQVVNENGETENKTVEKKVSVKVDNNSIISTYFSEPLTNGHLYISVGQATTNSEQLQSSALQASIYASIIESDTIPVIYTIEQNQYIVSEINKTIIPIIVGIVLLIESIILIIAFKLKGIVVSILQIGYLALLLLIIRYTNVYVTIAGLFALIIASILNMYFIYKIIYSINKNEAVIRCVNDNLKKYISLSIPVLIIAIVFCFVNWLEIKSFGMIIFWGYVVFILYNIIFTKGILKNILN